MLQLAAPSDLGRNLLLPWLNEFQDVHPQVDIRLLLSDRIRRWVGDSVVSATEKLMGLVLTAIAVEMILAGLKRYFLG